MRRSFILMTICAGFLAGCQKANGPLVDRTSEKTVGAGREVVLGTFGFVEDDCSTKKISVQLVEEPSRGTVDIFADEDFPNFGSGNVRAKCNERRLPGFKAVYKAKPDYSGTDTATLLITFPDGKRTLRWYNITVK